jgi:hypothetical protein
MTDSPENIETEVGATGGDLRYWLAKEALRQSETRIAGQATSLQAMETRATSLLTWSVTLCMALVAAAVDERFRWAAVAGAAFAMATAAIAIAALWPRVWFAGGHRPSSLDKLGHDTELGYLEQMALGNETAGDRNEGRLRGFARLLRLAWISFAFAPASAAALLAWASWARL